ncbi:MAG: shikimate kinase [Acidobacteriota bacterium]|nr:shikimate kinase [Acidobacteriota bacterium]
MILKLKQTPGIFLTGFMASGKTTIGKLLAERIGWQFTDLDQDIETSEQAPIGAIFATQGEAEFRRIETEALRWRIRKIRAGCAAVVALGGGTYAQPENAELIEHSGVVLWLDCPFDIVERRVLRNGHRPLARDPALLRQLYEDRQAAYSRAPFHISVEDENTEHSIE